MQIPIPNGCLRLWNTDDLRDLVQIANNPSISRYLTNRFPSPYTEADAQAWITNCVLQATKGRLLSFAIEYKSELVGGIELMPKSDVHSRTTELGYWLGEPFWGQGIMPEAVKAICKYGFETLQFARIQANVFSPNKGSMRVLEKSGFEHEGCLRKMVFKNGNFWDAHLYALINPKY